MKKTLCFLILSLFAINCTACSSNVNNSNPTFENVTQITSPASKAVEETTLEPETTQSDVLSTLSEDDLIQSIVSDFTIDGVNFTYKKCSDNLYLVNSDNDKIDIDIALLKLDNSAPMQHHVDDASAALFINDPKKESGLQKFFYTHPPISERVERLKQM